MVRQKYSEIALQDKETNAKLMLWLRLLSVPKCITSWQMIIHNWKAIILMQTWA